jgi:exopolysaccharide biosynthesis WecB/TagA/CpsF family protein
MSVDEAAARVTGRAPSSPFAYVVTPNAQHTVAAYRGDERFAGPQRTAWLILNDSRILRLLAALLFGLDLPLASGSDLVERLFETGAMQGESLTVIGGDTALAAHIRRRYAPASLAQHIPPMGFYNSPQEVSACLAFIRAHPARYVFFVVGAPQSEMLASLLARERSTKGVGLCVGSALNFLTGRIRRAPRIVQAAHLEWLYRLAQNPARHARRVFLESAPILWIALRERMAASRAAWSR